VLRVMRGLLGASGERLSGRPGRFVLHEKLPGMLRSVTIMVAVAVVTLGLSWHALGAESGLGEYRLGTGDRLEILTFGRLDLSGEFEVRAPGAIGFPLLGAIDVLGRTPTELENDISHRLMKDYQINATVTIQIEQYRPFYIMGDVMAPGRYSYAPGLTVLQAVVIAGGYYLFRPSDVTAQIDAIRADENYRIFTIREQAALLRRARLLAERDDQPAFGIPSELLPFQDDAGVQVALAAERKLFEARREGFISQVTLLEAQPEVFNKEIAALKAAIAATVEQRRLLDLELKDAQTLLDKGLTNKPRVLGLQRVAAGLTAEESQNRAFLARAQQNIGKIEEQIAQHRANFREEVEQHLVETQTELAELVQRRAAARDIIAATGRWSSTGQTAEVPGARNRFVIRRPTADGIQEIEASDTTLIMPNDVIEVPVHVGSAPGDAATHLNSISGDPRQPATGTIPANSGPM
jgi:polysaccharide biosynthesis/export protein ExoF